MALAWRDLDSATLFAALPAPAIVLSADGGVVAANACAEELFEQPLADGKTTVMTLLAQPERQRLDPLAWLQKWAERPDAPELDYVYLSGQTASGVTKQLSARVAKVNIDQQTYYLVTMHDVSRWEERLREERDAHRVASRILAISADAVVMVDDEANITYINDSANRLFGYAPGALLGQSLSQLIPERYREQHPQFMIDFLQGVTPSRLMGERGPVVALSASGEEIPVDVSISRITSQGKHIFSAQLRDLREHQQYA